MREKKDFLRASYTNTAVQAINLTPVKILEYSNAGYTGDDASSGFDPKGTGRMAPNTLISELVHEYANGDKAALDRLLPLIYTELRGIARKHLRGERPSHTLQPTALVHEMYARLAAQAPPDVRDRIHFLGVASHVMRQILIDHARTQYAQKRGGRQAKLSLKEAQDACMERPAIMIRIDDALNLLARHDPHKARLIEMRFFGGLTAEESAAVLNLAVNTVRRDLRVAQAWLQRELDQSSDGPSESEQPGLLN